MLIKNEKFKKAMDNTKEWADAHPIAGYPVRHPVITNLLTCVVVALVYGIVNQAKENKRKQNDEITISTVAPSVEPQRAIVNPSDTQYIYRAFYTSFIDGINIKDNQRNTWYDNSYFYDVSDYNLTGSLSSSFWNVTQCAEIYNINFPCAETDLIHVRIHWRNTAQIDNFKTKDFCFFCGVDTEIDYRATVVIYNMDNFPVYSTVIDSYNQLIDCSNSLTTLRGVTFEIVIPRGMYTRMTPIYVGDNNIKEMLQFSRYKNVNDAYSDGYDAGQDALIESGYKSPEEVYASNQAYYNEGRDRGLTEGASKDITLTKLFWNVVDQPFAVIYNFLNFDVLGVNLFAFLSGLVTLGLIGFIIKLII